MISLTKCTPDHRGQSLNPVNLLHSISWGPLRQWMRSHLHHNFFEWQTTQTVIWLKSRDFKPRSMKGKFRCDGVPDIFHSHGPGKWNKIYSGVNWALFWSTTVEQWAHRLRIASAVLSSFAEIQIRSYQTRKVKLRYLWWNDLHWILSQIITLHACPQPNQSADGLYRHLCRCIQW